MTKERQLLLVLSRIDEYLGRVDSKANFWITCNIFVIGALVFNSNILDGELQWSWAHVLMVSFLIFVLMVSFLILAILFSATGMLWAFLAITPFLKSGNTNGNKKYTTLLYFGSISHLSYDEYDASLQKSSKADRLRDIERQTHLLSIALNKKFEKIRKATQYSLFAFIFAIISAFFKIFISLKGV